MEDKKPKIDLKSRLGKKTVSSPAVGSIPPPAGMPSGMGVPKPVRAGGQPEPSPAPPFASGRRPLPYPGSTPRIRTVPWRLRQPRCASPHHRSRLR